MTIAERQGSRMFRLRAATNLARLWRDEGGRNEAGDLLAPLYAWFTKGFDTPDLQEAKALLDELRGQDARLTRHIGRALRPGAFRSFGCASNGAKSLVRVGRR